MTMPAYEEMKDSPVENDDGGTFTAQMKVLCAWADRYDLMDAMVGDRTVYPHIPTGLAVAINASSVGFGKCDDAGSGLVAYEKSLVTINFSDAVGISGGGGEGPDPTDLYSETLEPWVENIPLPVRDIAGRPFYAWEGDVNYKLEDKEAPVIQNHGCAYVFKRYRQASIPAAAFSLVGKVNASAVTSLTLGVTFEAESLLHTPPTTERTVTSAGTAGWDLTYKFNYRPNFDPITGAAGGWNTFWHGRLHKYATIYLLNPDGTVAAGPVKPYPTGNFALL